jgi:glycerol-3-phosphate dehydrogenase subunit C
VTTEVVYPGCCGMPQLEQGDLDRLAKKALNTAAVLLPYVDKGYDIVLPIPSCALMMKFEWPLILPEDASIRRLAEACFDISEYVVDIAKKEGLAPGLRAIDGGVVLHLACHARAQNIGPKGAEMLRLLPQTKVTVVERCSGHGGSWGIKTENFPVALKIGKPAMLSVVKSGASHLCSECPLAGAHLAQGIEGLDGDHQTCRSVHPIQLIAKAYDLI